MHRGEGRRVGGKMRGRSRDRRGGVFALRTLKNGECQNEIKKKCGKREQERVRVDDRVKNEEGKENPV